MKLKNMWKRFWTLDVHNHEGFTLVELIIVIAILAILSTGAIAGYSAYVERANIQADKTLAAEVANALMLAYYADPNAGDMAVSIVLSTDPARASQDNDFAISAMNAAYGENWRNALKLKYSKWGNGVAVSQEVLAFFMGVNEDSPLYDIFQGNADISYTDNMHELFDMMEETAILIAGKRATLGSGANMVSNAAGITNGMTVPNGYNSAAEYFAEKWASSAWDSSIMMGGDGSDYNADAGKLTEDKLTDAIANAAAIKARNVALATYLAGKGFDDAYNAIANFNYSNSSVPRDAAERIFEGEADDLGLTLTPDMEEAIIEYFNLEGNDPTQSQAYTDGLAYFAMMSTVDSLSDSTNLDKSNDETWWNDLSSAVDIYSAIANGAMSVEDLNNMYSSVDASDNTVVVMLMVVNGEPTVMISPTGANS